MAPTRLLIALLTGLALTVSLRSQTGPRPGIDWPSFRGIRAAGVADGYVTPTTWNASAKARCAMAHASRRAGHVESDCVGR